VSAAGDRRSVTIVVPVYDDLPGLEACVASLIENVDFTRDHVVLSNDVGPQADVIEARLLELVGDHRGFTYHRNSTNLGFVGNCNHVVRSVDDTDNHVLLLNSDTITTAGFVDEMSAVLASSPTHGIVTARSNNATIASMPLARRNPNVGRTPERTRAVWDVVSPLLPRFTIAPVAMGFCYLVRREVIEAVGFFDEAFAPGYGEENDLCLRAAEAGWSSVIANHALVYHVGSTSFSGDRGPRLRFAHEKLLVERHPHYVAALQIFLQDDRDPVDAFADVIAPGDDLIRVAVTGRLGDEDATSRLAEGLRESLGEAAVVTVVVPGRRVAGRRRASTGLAVMPETDHRRVYDLCVHAGRSPELRELLVMNTLSPRWIVRSTPEAPARLAARTRGQRGRVLAELAASLSNSTYAADASESSLADLVRTVARRPVDPAGLRLRWTRVISTGVAAGRITYPRQATLRSRATLALAAWSPRTVDRLRSSLHR
jgi:GT2 family glycosyltransferase